MAVVGANHMCRVRVSECESCSVEFLTTGGAVEKRFDQRVLILLAQGRTYSKWEEMKCPSVDCEGSNVYQQLV